MASYDLVIVGGHHSSAVPIIKNIKNTHKILFVGHKYASVLNKNISSEYKEITSLGIDYIYLKSPKFYNVKGFLKYLKLIKSIFRSLTILIKSRPKLVLSFGGYLAVPVSIAAKILFIPVITHEQTLEKGLANKVVSKMSSKILLSWPTERLSDKQVVVGLPLRDEIKKVGIKNLGNSYKVRTVFVQGGKQGSHKLNEFIFENIEHLIKQFNVIHQTSNHSEYDDYETAKKLSKKYVGKYKCFDFIFGDDYTKVLKNSDLLVSRSGAHITYEICYLKMPSILIPIPWVSGNEQYKLAVNAAKYTPSVVLQEKDLNISNFDNSLSKVKSKIRENKRYKQVIENSDEKVVELILSYLK